MFCRISQWVRSISTVSLVVFILIVYSTDSQVTYEDRHDYCQLETFNATCGDGEIIVMESAFYGRMRAGRCITRSYGNLGCSANVLPALDKRCSGKRSCSLGIPDPVLHKNHPCPKDFTSYFEADYQCVRVSTSSSESCNDTPVQVQAGEGYIAGGLLPGLAASSGGRSASSYTGCSWVIAAQSGQKINLTIINFDYRGATTGHRHSYRRKGHTGVSCTDVAMVTDGDTKQNIRLCEEQAREMKAYLSNSDTIELQIYNRALPSSSQSANGLFLIQYKAVGCANIDIPTGMWMRREGDNLLVKCNLTEETWYLTCENESWKGRIGNCSSVKRWIVKEPLRGDDQVPYGILITVAIGVALGVFLGALLLIVVFIIRKHRISQTTRGDQRTYQIRECPARKPMDTDIKGYTPVLDERGHFPISAESFTLSTSFGSDRTMENNPDLTTVETPLTAKDCILPLPPPPGTTTFCLHPERHIYESTIRGKPCSIRC